MSLPITTHSPVDGPISEHWTIEELLNWFAEDDTRLSDTKLQQPLLLLEEALTGTGWDIRSDISAPRRPPSIVALVRSIALHSRAHAAMRAYTLAEVTAGASSLSDTQAGSKNLTTGMQATGG